MKANVGQITDKGLNPKRASNEDNLLAMPERGLYLVADGVGGRLGGEVASRTVVEVFSRVFGQEHHEDLRKLIENTIDFCNQKVFEDARADPELDGMATTIALVAVEGKRAVVAHVGDSRVYRYDEKGLICLTEDHSEVGEAMRAGMLTAEQAAKHPRRNVISRAIGADVEIEPDFREIEIDVRASFILCTDGITRHITDDEIARLMRGGTRPQAICEKMKELCYTGGAEDNLTAIVVDFGESRYVEEATKPKLAASAARGLDAPPPAPKQKIEIDLKPQAMSGPLRMPHSAKPRTAAETTAPPPQPVAGESAAGPAAADAGAPAEANAAATPANPAAKKKPSLGTKEVTIKFPTVLLPQKDEMSRVMKMSLLGAALLAGIVVGLLLYGPFMRIFGGFLSGADLYATRGSVRRPTDPEVAAAFALHLGNRTAEARKQLDDILIANPKNAEAQMFLGRIDYDQKQYQNAITRLGEAAKLDPNLQDVWEHLALAYMAIGQNRNAIDAVQRAIKMSAPAATPEAGAQPTAEPAMSPTPVG
ncbi:MAG: protein phosphatase 2C domain-containing protein [Blastocatellia bacterium]